MLGATPLLLCLSNRTYAWRPRGRMATFPVMASSGNREALDSQSCVHIPSQVFVLPCEQVPAQRTSWSGWYNVAHRFRSVRGPFWERCSVSPRIWLDTGKLASPEYGKGERDEVLTAMFDMKSSVSAPADLRQITFLEVGGRSNHPTKATLYVEKIFRYAVHLQELKLSPISRIVPHNKDAAGTQDYKSMIPSLKMSVSLWSVLLSRSERQRGLPRLKSTISINYSWLGLV